MWYIHRFNDIVCPIVCTVSLSVVACSTYKTQSDYGVNWKTRKELAKPDKVKSEPFSFGEYKCLKTGDDISCTKP